MKIENKEGTKKVIFDQVKRGEIFRYNFSIFIKTEEEADHGILAVDLETGETSVFYMDDKVEIVTGTLTLD